MAGLYPGMKKLYVLGATLLASSLVGCAGNDDPQPNRSFAEPEASSRGEAAPDPEHAKWPLDVAVEIDRGCTTSSCRGTSVAINVTNLGRDDAQIVLVLAADGLDGRTARVRADGQTTGTVRLAGGERRTFLVNANALPVQPLRTLASATAELTVTVGGVTATSISSPVVYEHDPDFRTVTLYDDAAGLDRGGRLDPRDVDRPLGRVWSGRAFVDVATLPANGGDGYTIGGATTTWGPSAPVPQPPSGDPPPPGSSNVCFDLKVQYNDAGIGEDYINAGTAVQKQRAAYMRAWITKSGVPGITWDGYLNSAGCTGYKALSGSYTLHVQSMFEKQVGGAPAHHDVKFHSGTIDQVQGWTRAFTVSAPTTVLLEALSTSKTANVSGVMARMYAGSDTWVPAGTNTTYVDKGCPGLDPPTDSCYSPGDAVYIGPGASPAPAQSSDKFLVAHEYGHFVQMNRFFLYQYDYNAVSDSLAACRCDHVVSANQYHCIQSLEQYEAAFVEGFGHFYASKLFNNRLETDCHFGYYKEVWILFGTLVPTVPVDCASTIQWRDAHCSAIPNSAVEMDVMRFLWALYSTLPDRLTMDEIGDLLAAAAANSPGAMTWNDIKAAAAQVFGLGSAKYNKVVNQASIHAVD
ncbi:MAG: hypothetical protein HOV81_42530 [Kofleriaceae bacterium]|nr:hypothetical protein [Kofleriaceae bacterium]